MNEESINLEEAKKQLVNKERVINILLSRIAKLEYEVERQDNIIKELEKWLEDKDKNALQDDNYWEVLDKLQELRRIYE